MSDSSLALTLVRAVVSLLLVLGLLVLCLRMLAKRGGFAGPTRPSVDVEIVGRRQLSRNASVQVVRVGEDVLVLGVTDSHISTLHHLSAGALSADEGEEAEVPLPAETTPPTIVEALRRQGQLGRLVVDVAGGRGRGGRHRGGPGARTTTSRRPGRTVAPDRHDTTAEITAAPSARTGSALEPATDARPDAHDRPHGHHDKGGGDA